MFSKQKWKNLAINLGSYFIFVFIIISAANIIFSNIHYSAFLDNVEKTERIMEKANENLALGFVDGNKNCIRVGVVGRDYCGQSEWDSLVVERISPNMQERKSELEFESYLLDTSNKFPFGGEFTYLKSIYGKHLDSWIDYMSRIGDCRTVKCFSIEWSKPNNINSTFEISHVAFSKAVPLIDFMHLNKRIEKIFKA